MGTDKLKEKEFGSQKIVVFGLAIIAGIGLAVQKSSTKRPCVIEAEIYGPNAKYNYSKQFSEYLGTADGVSWRIFSNAVDVYLSEAYFTCADQDKAIKQCVEGGVKKVRAILVNKDMKTPKERWRDLLSLKPPRACLNDSSARLSEQAQHQTDVWIHASKGDFMTARQAMNAVPRVNTSSGSATSTQSLAAAGRLYNEGLIHYMANNNFESKRAWVSASKEYGNDYRLSYVLALVHLRNEDYDAALLALEKASENIPKASNKLSLDEIKRDWAKASAYRGLREYEKSDGVFDELIEKAIESLGEDHRLVGQLYFEQAWIRADRRGYGQAQKLLRKAIKIFNKHYDQNHPKILDAYIAMALAQVEGDLAEEAIETLDKAADINDSLGAGQQRRIELQFIRALAFADRYRYLDKAIELAGSTLYELRKSELKLPHLEVRIQRWLEAL